MSRLPLIGITDCSAHIGLHAYHISGDINVHAVASAAWGLTMMLASMTNRLFPSDILDSLDGTPIPVTSFNIDPIHNGGPAFTQGTACDSARLVFAARYGKAR